jgi:TolA-binding protein
MRVVMTRTRRLVVLVALAVGACTAGEETVDGVTRLDAASDAVATRGVSPLADYYQSRDAAYRLNLVGSFAESEREYSRLLALVDEISPEDPEQRADALLHIALQLSNLEQDADAEAYFAQVEPIARTASRPTLAPKYHIFHAQHLLAAANDPFAAAEAELETALRLIELRRAELSAAEAAAPAALAAVAPVALDDGTWAVTEAQARRLNGARAAAETAGDEELVGTVGGRLATLEVQAYYLRARTEWLAAAGDGRAWLDRARTALARVPETDLGWLRALIDLQEAQVRREAGDLAGAARVLRSGIAAQRAVIANSFNEMRMLLRLGEIEAERGRLGAAREAFRRAVAIEGQEGYGIPPARLDALAATLIAAGGADAEAEALLFDALQGFTGEQTAKTVAMLAARLRAGDGPEAELLREVQALERRRNELEAQLNRLEADPEASVHDLRVVREQLARTESRLAERETAIAEALPGYRQLVGGQPLALAELQAVLADGEVFVQIQPGRERGVVFLVTAEAVEAAIVPLGEAGASAVARQLRAPFEVAGPIEERPFDVEAAYRLFETVLGPFRERILTADHLIVAPSDVLINVPPGLLVTEGPPRPVTDGDYSSVPFLARAVPSTVVVSATSFAHTRGFAPSDAEAAYVGFGDWRAPAGGATAWRSRLRGRGGGGAPECVDPSDAATYLGLFGPLPATRTEVVEATELFAPYGAESVLGAEFTDAAVRRRALADYQVVHFATHGALAREQSCLPEPALVTSLPEPGVGDGILEASEIVDLELDAELVVLSACETGLPGSRATTLAGLDSATAGGESLGGLARAFVFAGGRNVVVSHWQVPDVETAEMVLGFFEAARDGETDLAGALQRARLALIDDPATSHPEYWGAFTLVGDGARRLRLQAPDTTTAAATAP